MEREQSAQNELKVRAEKIKAHEKTVTELEQKNNDNQRQLKEYESKCERLEGEVNRVNAQRLNTSADEVSHEHSRIYHTATKILTLKYFKNCSYAMSH